MNVIYKIRNVVNQKFYVGSTVQTKVRFRDHRRKLRTGKHHCAHLQAAWNKYGEDCFKFEIVEEVNDCASLQQAEDRWLKEHVGKPYCYNSGWSSDAPWRGAPKEKHPSFGKAKTPEQREAISKTLKEFYAAAPTNHPRYGVKLTEEQIQRMRERPAKKGPEHYRWGKTLSDEVRKKIGDAQRGKKRGPRILTDEGRDKIRAAAALGHYSHWKGKKHSDESRAKMGTAIREVTTGIEFGTINMAIQHFGLKMPTVLRSLKSGKPLSKGPKAGLRFEYLDTSITP